jgi:hypothetical protein
LRGTRGFHPRAEAHTAARGARDFASASSHVDAIVPGATPAFCAWGVTRAYGRAKRAQISPFAV